MRYWKRDTEYGTMDDDGFVPDSEDISKEEYIASLPNISRKNEDEKKIRDKERGILRKLAIAELISEGYEFDE